MDTIVVLVENPLATILLHELLVTAVELDTIVVIDSFWRDGPVDAMVVDIILPIPVIGSIFYDLIELEINRWSI